MNRDYSLTYECTSYCSDLQQSCTDACNADSACVYECDYAAAACTNSCPCFQDCPSGCGSCDSTFCNCQDYQSNDDYKACETKVDRQYTQCIVNCDSGDLVCFSSCSREKDENMEKCPCRSGCPYGCPCDDYDCDNPSLTTPQDSNFK